MPRKRSAPKKKFKTVKARVELERRLLGKILKWADHMGEYVQEDVRSLGIDFGISWRNFRDKRHRAIWRAFETLDTRDIVERMRIIESEMYAEAALETDPRLIDPEADPVRGLPDSAARKQFEKRLNEGSVNGLAWFERELEAIGGLSVVGGKKYLQEIAEIGECELLSERSLAEDLFGRR